REPGRSDAREDAACSIAIRRGAELAQRFHHGVVLFLDANAWNALAAGNDNGLAEILWTAEGIDERGLADSSFAGNEDRAPPALRETIQFPFQPFELIVAVDETGGFHLAGPRER